MSVDEFLDAGAVTASAFGLEVGEVALLSHSENVVLALTTPEGERFAMRLHRPGYNTLAEMESEVQWVEALGRFGIPVPRAVPIVAPTETRTHYAPVDIGGVEHQVGVVSWVEGEPLGGPLTAGGPEMVGHYRRIGELAAQIRSHAGSWQAPTGFGRRRWDANGLVGEAPLWNRFWEVDLLTDEQRTLFSAARDRLVETLGAIPLDGDHFGLIHADLHLGNVMADEHGELTIIDFDDAGFGYFVHELAVALHPMLGEELFDDCVASLVNGYCRVHPLPDTEVALIEDFLAMRSLMIIGWLADRPEVPHYEHFDDIAGDIEAHIIGYLDAPLAD